MSARGEHDSKSLIKKIKCYDLILCKRFVHSSAEFLKGKKASAIILSFVHLCSPRNNSGWDLLACF